MKVLKGDIISVALMYAVRWDSREIVQLLLQHCIDVCFKEELFGWSAPRYVS
jgi:hypothetical protein